jgi:hypothetical protein
MSMGNKPRAQKSPRDRLIALIIRQADRTIHVDPDDIQIRGSRFRSFSLASGLSMETFQISAPSTRAEWWSGSAGSPLPTSSGTMSEPFL